MNIPRDVFLSKSSSQSSIKLRLLTSNISLKPSTSTSNLDDIQFQVNKLTSMQKKFQVKKLYSSYQKSKSVIQQGLLTPSHLNKYLKPKTFKSRINIRQESQFLMTSDLSGGANKLRAANFFLNVKQNAEIKDEIIKTSSSSSVRPKLLFLTKIQELFLKQKRNRTPYESTKSIQINDEIVSFD